ncbi:hypothetical protein [Aureibacter tunicatorum]|uniref:Uncharacterized protein n=1 Tax=Aureibacter tunicatorum TaxID=866807 RepID=A0AAE3XP17_9BACT|nr:hypothetical protein [Aureibacter tunicatorum]MDR6240020.1 hypothetical protein [Aureibacter tunicatorum]BDD04492.1 hypothetical protein AUTU_19750 [Aureibacter tunicatorum]
MGYAVIIFICLLISVLWIVHSRSNDIDSFLVGDGWEVECEDLNDKIIFNSELDLDELGNCHIRLDLFFDRDNSTLTIKGKGLVDKEAWLGLKCFGYESRRNVLFSNQGQAILDFDSGILIDRLKKSPCLDLDIAGQEVRIPLSCFKKGMKFIDGEVVSLLPNFNSLIRQQHFFDFK